MREVDIETCKTLHQLRYFGDLRTIIISGRTLVATTKNREENERIPIAFLPSLHSVSDWLRKKKKVDIRIECHPKACVTTILTPESLWSYQIHYKNGKCCVLGKRFYNQYSGALEDAIKDALTILQEEL